MPSEIKVNGHCESSLLCSAHSIKSFFAKAYLASELLGPIKTVKGKSIDIAFTFNSPTRS